MSAMTVCAQVARKLGESLRLVERRGFQLSSARLRSAEPKLKAVDCAFCGAQILVLPPGSDSFELECHACDTAFEATRQEVYAISLSAATKPYPRRFSFDLV